ncbi:MAG: cyclic nucleotide-binding protein [Pseudanabaena sp.]|nr:MAG: cyclic nucleotide-binding protein [Pseudanabaena sp.]
MTTIDLFKNDPKFITIPAGQVIFEKGGIADQMYAVIEGEVEISIDGKFLDVTGAGGIVGEMALIDSSPRSATAIAKTECKLVPVDAKRFSFLVQQTPNFALNVMKIMVERIRKLDALVLANAS